ncbi:MAG: DMT family transporter [Planctomycetota bacterium]
MSRPWHALFGGTGAALFATLCWATVPSFMKDLSRHMGAWDMNAYRYATAALMYLPFLVWFHRRGMLTVRLFLLSIFPAAVNVVAQVLWAMATYEMEAGLLGIYIKTSLVWSTAFSFLCFADERPLMRRPWFWIGSVITAGSVAGLYAVQPPTGAGTVTGLTIILACALFWGLYPISLKLTLKDTDPRLAFGLICVNTAAALAVLGAIWGTPAVIMDLSPATLGILVASAVVGIAVSHLSYCYALNTIGVIASTNITMVTPFITLMLAWVWQGEPITAAKAIFGLAIIANVAVITATQRRTIPAVPQAD